MTDRPETKEEWQEVVAGTLAFRHLDDYRRIDGKLTYVPPTTTRALKSGSPEYLSWQRASREMNAALNKRTEHDHS